MSYFALGLVYTKKCNSECDMCGLSCSPREEEKMSVDEAKEYIMQSKECFPSKRPIVAITGGEPMLYMDEMYEIIDYSAQLNAKRISMTSNCFWASDYDKTYEILYNLQECGLDHLRISCDEFHNKTVPSENVKNVLEAAKILQFSITIGCIVVKGGKSLSDVLNNLGSASLDYNFRQHACHPIGRAKEKFSEEDFYYSPLIKCCGDKGLISILPNGDTYPCGSMWAMNKNRLLGNAKEISLEKLIKKATENKHNKFIEENSVIPYINYLGQQDEKLKEKQFVDSCHACGYLFENYSLDVLDDALENIMNAMPDEA